MTYRINQKGIVVECDTPDEVIALSARLGVNLVHPALTSATPSFVGTDTAGDALIAEAAMLQHGFDPVSQRKQAEQELQQRLTAVGVPVAKVAKAAVKVKAPTLVRADRGSFKFLDELGINRSKKVEGFTTAQISAAITRNKAATGKAFKYETLDDETIKVKRIA